MRHCKCGSYAINNDPEQEICDSCYDRIQGWKAGMEEAAEIANSCDGANGRSRDAIIAAIRQRIEEGK